jgi:multidrug efflux system outer membrane protein
MTKGEPQVRRRGYTVTILATAFSLAAALSARAENGAASSAGSLVVTLPQCVEQGLAAGPGILISKTSVAMAQAQYTQAAAANSLGVTGTALANHQGAPYDTRLLALGQSPFAQDTARAGLSLSAPLSTSLDVTAGHTITEETVPGQTTQVSVSAGSTLWDGYPGGSSLASVQKAGLTLRITQTSEDSSRRTIVYQVKQAYYTMLAQQRQIGILQQTLLQRQQELSKTQSLFDARGASQIDLKQAQVNRKQAELDLLLAQGVLEVDREKLSALVGWPIEKAYSVAEAEDPSVPSLDVAAAVSSALSKRADLRQLVLSQASTDIDIALTRGKATPTVSATSGLTYTHDWSANNGLGVDVLSWNAGLNVAAPIYDAGSIDAQIRQATLQKQSFTLQQQQLAAAIATDVKNAVYSLKDLLARVDLAQASLDLAQDQYDLARMQFESGVSSNLDVLAASVARTTAEVGLARARSDAQLGVLALQNAMGE